MIACKDCRHFSYGWGPECHHPTLFEDDPIHGKVHSYPIRNREAGKGCGVEAKLFEPMPPKQTFMQKIVTHYGYRWRKLA